MPKVSVVVPAYNAAKYLRRCLDSLAAQTLADIEVLMVNDGSTDILVELGSPAQRLADSRWQVPWVLRGAPGQLLALGVVHVANVVQSPRLPDLGVTPRPGLPPKQQSQGARRPDPAHRAGIPTAWFVVLPAPGATSARASPCPNTKVGVMRRGLSLSGHPSNTPDKDSSSATSKGDWAKSVTSPQWSPPTAVTSSVQRQGH